MTATDELLVGETQQRVVVTEELRVEDDLDSVGRIIEQIASLQSLDNWVLVVIVNIVRSYGRPAG